MRPPTNGIATPPVPIQERVTDFVSAVTGRSAAATKVTPSRFGPTGEHVLGVYRDDLGRVAALVTADLAFAAVTGAALAMIPATAVKEVLSRGVMSETLFENFREVANITATILNTSTTPHLALIDAWLSDDADLPSQVWEILANPSKRREFAITVDGYGSGNMGIVIG
jgi:hypothetical protein